MINKAKNFRNQEQNKEDAMHRLKELILASMVVQKIVGLPSQVVLSEEAYG